jgi:hypothetical protein
VGDLRTRHGAVPIPHRGARAGFRHRACASTATTSSRARPRCDGRSITRAAAAAPSSSRP